MATPSSPKASSLGRMDADYATAGCVDSIFRRLVCGRVQKVCSTAPSTASTSAASSRRTCVETGQQLSKVSLAGAGATTPPPSIVARLMGLETAAPVAMGRSRSVGSVEGRSPAGRDGRFHATSSLSFRETAPPAFLRKETSEEFLVLSFEPSGCRKRVRALETARRTKTEAAAPTKSEEKRVIKTENSTKTANRAKAEVEFGFWSQNSSPVSVLDVPSDWGFECCAEPPLPTPCSPAEHQHALPPAAEGAGEDPIPPRMKARRRRRRSLSTGLEIMTHKLEFPSKCERDQPPKKTSGGGKGEREGSAQSSDEPWAEIHELINADLKELNWVSTEELQDISCRFEPPILDFLIEELVDELLLYTVYSRILC